MRQLLLILFSLPSFFCSVANEVREWQDLKEQQSRVFLMTTKADMVADELFSQYPSLKPSTEEEIVLVKRTLSAFLEMDKDLREMFKEAGSMQKEKEFMKMLNELTEIAEEEFEDLDEEDQDYLQTVEDYVWHKLTVQLATKAFKKKKLEYKKKKMSEEEIMLDIITKGKALHDAWNPDMGEKVAEWTRMLKEINDEL